MPEYPVMSPLVDIGVHAETPWILRIHCDSLRIWTLPSFILLHCSIHFGFVLCTAAFRL